MRHKIAVKHLGRTSAHRLALRRNLASSLFEHGTISTTIEKAKFVRPFAEKLITLAKDGSLHARRRAIALLQNRDICKVEDGEPVKESTVIQRLFDEIGPKFAERNGGYTRIVRLPLRRVGDNGRLAILQLVGEETKAALERRSTPATEEPVVVEDVPAEAAIEEEAISDEGAEEQSEPEESASSQVTEDEKDALKETDDKKE